MPQFVMHQFMQLGDNDLAELASSFGMLSFDDPFFCSDVPPTQRCLEHPLGDAAVLQQMFLARPSLIGLLFLVSVKRQQVIEPDAFMRRKRAFVDEYASIIENQPLAGAVGERNRNRAGRRSRRVRGAEQHGEGRARGPPVRLYTRVAFRSAARAASLSSRPVQALCESGGPKTGRASTQAVPERIASDGSLARSTPAPRPGSDATVCLRRKGWSSRRRAWRQPAQAVKR